MENSEAPISPIVLQEGLTSNSHVEVGLTKREYFAGLAMQGILAGMQGILAVRQNSLDSEMKWVSECATKIADELLKQLECLTKN
jgi:hypothetical protein